MPALLEHFLKKFLFLEYVITPVQKIVTKKEVGQKGGCGWIFVWDHGDQWIFAI
jgi:hypothetical protein